MLHRSLVFVGLALLTACGVPSPVLGSFPCEGDDDCEGGFSCDARFQACRAPEGGAPPLLERPDEDEVAAPPAAAEAVLVETLPSGGVLETTLRLPRPSAALIVLENDGCASGRLRVAGQRLVRPRDLNPHVARVDHVVELDVESLVELEARGPSSCALSLVVITGDDV